MGLLQRGWGVGLRRLPGSGMKSSVTVQPLPVSALSLEAAGAPLEGAGDPKSRTGRLWPPSGRRGPGQEPPLWASGPSHKTRVTGGRCSWARPQRPSHRRPQPRRPRLQKAPSPEVPRPPSRDVPSLRMARFPPEILGLIQSVPSYVQKYPLLIFKYNPPPEMSVLSIKAPP